MNFPTQAECQEIFSQYKVPRTIRLHCETVSQVATFLATEMKQNGSGPKLKLDLELVRIFSLLHDVMKAVVLERLTDPPYNYQPTQEEVTMHLHLREKFPQMSETKVANLIFKDKYPEFAALFLELDELSQNPEAVSKVREETRLVHYVDWRVLGNKVVPLSRRIHYISEKYGGWITRKKLDWNRLTSEQEEYEQQLFKLLPFSAEELGKRFQEHISEEKNQ